MSSSLCRRTARAVVLGLSSLALGATVFALPSGPVAVAAPPVTIADAKAQIAQLQVDAEALDQDYIGVKEQVDQAKAQLALKQQDMKAQAAKVAAMRRQVGQVALAQYQHRDVDTAAKLFLTSDTSGFLNQVSTMEKVGSNQNSVLQNFQQQQASLADLQKSSRTDVLTLQRKEADLQKLRSQSDKKIAESKAVLAKLTEQERAALAAEKKKQEREARAAAERAAAAAAASKAERTAPSDGQKSAPRTTARPANQLATSKRPSSTARTAAVAGSGKGAAILGFATRQLGKPYVFGAQGPSAYDCSGLTSAAYKSVGISLGRTTTAQYNQGRPVAKSDLRPGDLVFFYGGISHVGLYAGKGVVIHAPHPGSSVQYAKMSTMPFAGARRLG